MIEGQNIVMMNNKTVGDVVNFQGNNCLIIGVNAVPEYGIIIFQFQENNNEERGIAWFPYIDSKVVVH